VGVILGFCGLFCGYLAVCVVRVFFCFSFFYLDAFLHTAYKREVRVETSKYPLVLFVTIMPTALCTSFFLFLSCFSGVACLCHLSRAPASDEGRSFILPGCEVYVPHRLSDFPGQFLFIFFPLKPH